MIADLNGFELEFADLIKKNWQLRGLKILETDLL